MACKGRLRFFDYATGNELDGPDLATEEPEPADIKPTRLVSSTSSRNSRKGVHSAREKLLVPEDLNQNETSEPSAHESTAMKAHKQLASGAEVDTDVLVDLILDKIREIPCGVGWLLDGFPSTVEQARLLEQKLNALLHKADEVSSLTNHSISGFLPVAEQSPKFQGLDFIVVLEENDADLIERFLDISKASKLIPDPEPLIKDHEEEVETGKVTNNSPHVDPKFFNLHAKMVNFEEQLPRIEAFYRKHSECCAFHHLSTPEGQSQPELTKRELELTLTLSNEENLPAGCAAAYVAVYRLLEDHLKDNIGASATVDVSGTSAKSDLSVQGVPTPCTEGANNPAGEGHTIPQIAGDKEAVIEAPLPEPLADALPGAGNDPLQSPTPVVPTTNVETPGTLQTGSLNPSDAVTAYVGANPCKEVALLMTKFWVRSETVYSENIRLICRLLRQQRESIIRHLFDCRNDMAVFVRRPDELQPLVTEFQKDFNKIPLKLRHDQETMAELHCRLDDLRDHLYDQIDSMKAESEAKLRIRLGMEKWMPEKMTLISNLYMLLLQTELDRFQDRLRLILDFYASAGSASGAKPDAESSPPDVLDLSQSEYKRLPMLDVLPFEQIRILEEASESEFPSPSRRNEPASNRPTLSMRSASNAKVLAGLPRSTRAGHKSGQGVDVSSYPLPTDAEGLVDAFQVDIPVIGKGASQDQIMAAVATYGPGPLNAQMIIQAVQGTARTKASSQSTRHTARTEVAPSAVSGDLLTGNAAPPTDTNLKFIFDVTFLTQQARLCPELVEDAKGTAKKTKRKTSRHTSRARELHTELSEPSAKLIHLQVIVYRRQLILSSLEEDGEEKSDGRKEVVLT
ncbi:unnamed protein product [Schistocephalus solidus]|uniref:Uncharacterized protein n=1 Tax=Schistocephalus solidus TaxID=70667 RepID=A0A3P7CH72_SCHSO|nr:unnamed protein product [Schistocephalus solidus]